MKTINFTRSKLHDLRGSYQKALHAGHEEFEFEGVKVLTSYAKYLIEYLDTQITPIRNFPLESPNEHHERT